MEALSEWPERLGLEPRQPAPSLHPGHSFRRCGACGAFLALLQCARRGELGSGHFQKCSHLQLSLRGPLRSPVLKGKGGVKVGETQQKAWPWG